MKRYNRVFVSMILLVSLMTGCGASSGSMDSNSMSEGAMEAPSESFNMAETETEKYHEATGGMATTEDIGIQVDMPVNRKMIQTARIAIETTTYSEAKQKLEESLEKQGGFMQSWYEYDTGGVGYEGKKRLELTLRLPQEELTTFLNNANQYGFVERIEVEGEDITDKYSDVERRIEILEIQVEQLEMLLGETGDLDTMVRIREEIGDLMYQIDTYKGTKNNYDSLVAYATIYLELNEILEHEEVKVVPLTFGEKIIRQFKDSCGALVDVLKGMSLMLIAMVPFLIIIIPIGVVVYFIYKRIRKHKK